jgi:hypothetical protein
MIVTSSLAAKSIA